MNGVYNNDDIRKPWINLLDFANNIIKYGTIIGMNEDVIVDGTVKTSVYVDCHCFIYEIQFRNGRVVQVERRLKKGIKQ